MSDLTPERLGLPLGRPKMAKRRFPGLRTIVALIVREMSSTYGRSPGGYLWAFLEPVAGILLLTAVFAAFMRDPPLGTSFPLFFATGLIPFSMFLAISSSLAQAINFSRPLLAYPSVTWVDALVARFTLQFLTNLLVGYVLFVGIMMLFPTPVILKFQEIALSLVLAALLGVGIGTLNCYLFTAFPIWQRGWSILTRPLFIVSGVIYPYHGVPEPWQGWLWYNPVVHVVGIMRQGFYFSYDGDYISITYVMLVTGLTAVTGLVFLSRYHRDLINL